MTSLSFIFFKLLATPCGMAGKISHQCDRRRAPFVIVALVNHKECECGGVCFVRLREDVSDDVLSSGKGKKSSWGGGSKCDKILSFVKQESSLFSSSYALFCI